MTVDPPADLVYALAEPSSVGSASVSLFPRAVTDEERERFAAEDADRDGRRIPPGFRAP